MHAPFGDRESQLSAFARNRIPPRVRVQIAPVDGAITVQPATCVATRSTFWFVAAREPCCWLLLWLAAGAEQK